MYILEITQSTCQKIWIKRNKHTDGRLKGYVLKTLLLVFMMHKEWG